MPMRGVLKIFRPKKSDKNWHCQPKLLPFRHQKVSIFNKNSIFLPKIGKKL
jgi:hypothetical protein